MSGELVIQVIDMGRFEAIRPAFDELDAARALSPKSRAVLAEAAATPVVHRHGHWRFPDIVDRILRHPELELRVFLSPADVDAVIEDVLQVLCFKDGANFSLVDLVGPTWLVLDWTFRAFMDLDWFRPFFIDPERRAGQLAHPRRGEVRYRFLRREDLALAAAGLRRMLDDPAVTDDTREAAEGFARLASEALASEELTLAYVSLL
jgi:hypothetical protein